MTKFCKDCKFIKRTTRVASVCSHPNNGLSLVSGQPLHKSPAENRSNSQSCGEEGKWWEQLHHEYIVYEFVWTTLGGIKTYETSEEDFEKALTKAKNMGYKPRKWYNPLTWQNHHTLD
jgi:hypothetical protein